MYCSFNHVALPGGCTLGLALTHGFHLFLSASVALRAQEDFPGELA